eukprot:TRINITY_DN54382_c0_g1_i1.p1 TRINITY_DN54382_c0_g1~~TRINITY_DN54382_c0_g1_i1.p1  ORF type:complete len:295 (+),score=31.78 TRINITY_DN54382_c0_g1_i1:107-991(+)
MTPRTAALVLSLLMCFTVTCYFFRIPDDLRRKGNAGLWGSPNAEFNWCEPDYLTVDFIAEPVNTISNLGMVFLPLLFLSSHPKLDGDIIGLALLEISIGVGSICFHATLRYSMQLLDEVPMLWYILLGSASFLRRLNGRDLRRPAGAYGVVLTLGILLTEQHSLLHEVFRGLMAVSFSISLIAIGWGSFSLVERLKDDVPEKCRWVVTRAEQLQNLGFASFVLSVMCWLLDNYYCAALWNLPMGLPYPHFHTWWHIFVAVTLQLLLVTLQLDDMRKSEELSLSRCFGILPVVLG